MAHFVDRGMRNMNLEHNLEVHSDHLDRSPVPLDCLLSMWSKPVVELDKESRWCHSVDRMKGEMVGFQLELKMLLVRHGVEHSRQLVGQLHLLLVEGERISLDCLS